MKKFKVEFSEVEIRMLKENKPKGFWMTEYLMGKILEAEGLLPAGFWKWKLKRQVEYLGLRNGKGRQGPAVQGTPIEVLQLMGRATNRELSDASGVGHAQTRRRLWRDPQARWDGDLKVWEYRE